MKEICNSLQHPKSVGQNTVHISQRLGVGEFRMKKDSCCTTGELHDCAYNEFSFAITIHVGNSPVWVVGLFFWLVCF